MKMDCTFLQRVTYLLLHETCSVTDSKNKVLVRVFVQRESTGGQLEVQVIQRCKVDLWKAKSDSEGTYDIFNLNTVFLFCVRNNYLGSVRPQTARLPALQSLHCGSTSPCFQKNMTHLLLKMQVRVVTYREKALGTTACHHRLKACLSILLLGFQSILFSGWKTHSS